MKVVLPVSLDKFFELFLSDEAIYSFSHHRILIGGPRRIIIKFTNRYWCAAFKMAAHRWESRLILERDEKHNEINWCSI